MPWHEFRTNVRHLPTKEQDRVQQAFELGKKMHEGQKRKSGEPYFNHPVAVAHMLSDMGGDADTIIAALLHDTVEDTPLTLGEVLGFFGKDVYALIEGVTKLSRTDIGEQPNLDEQIETLRKIFTLMEQDVRIMVIKLVDRLHNMQTVEFLPSEKQRALAQETMEVYVKIADRLCMQDLRDELEALCLGVLEPDTFAKLSTLRTKNEQRGQEILRVIRPRLDQNFPEHGNDARMQHEHKSWDNVQEQLQAEGSAVTGISGVSIAFVCDSVDTCYRVLGSLHQMWQRELMSFQDFINAPAINGYRGLHTTIILEDGTRVRCKIRTPQMQEYARKGVASLCFRTDFRELPTALPWTQRIAPLSQDIRERSRDFWDSLQSDILGDSITIHGPGDQTVLVPKGATALDGAFYLFGDDAARLNSIGIGGKESPLDAKLEHAVSLNVTLGPDVTAELSWLQKAKTGYATASIRSVLAKDKTDVEKIPIGKDLLQSIMTERKKGFIEEFDEEKLIERLKKLGYGSLRETFVALADGRVDAKVVFRALFEEKNSNGKNGNGQRCSATFTFDKTSGEILGKLTEVYRKYTMQLSKMQLWSSRDSSMTHVRYTLMLTHEQQENFATDLKAAGARNVEIVIRTKREVLLIAAVIFPWALNPVLAKWLLTHGMQPLSLISIRMVTFSLFTTVLFAVWWALSPVKLKPIRAVTALASLPALGNAGLTFTTYFALLLMPPSIHLTILRFNAFLIPLLSGRGKRGENKSLLVFLLLLGPGVFILLLTLGISYLTGLMLSVLALLFYTFYSLSMEHTLQQHKIDIRYPYLLLHMGAMLGVGGFVLGFFQPLSSLFNSMTIPALLYALICVCIPHAAYSALLKTTRFKHFTDLLLLEVPIAMAMEAALLGIMLSPLTYAAVGVILITLLVLRWRKLQIPV